MLAVTGVVLGLPSFFAIVFVHPSTLSVTALALAAAAFGAAYASQTFSLLLPYTVIEAKIELSFPDSLEEGHYKKTDRIRPNYRQQPSIIFVNG